MQDRFLPQAIKSINAAIDKQVDAVSKAVIAGGDWAASVDQNADAIIAAYSEIYKQVMPYFAGQFYDAVEPQTKGHGGEEVAAWEMLADDWLKVQGAQKVVGVDNYTKSVIAQTIAGANKIDPDTGAVLGRLSAAETAKLIQEKFSDMKDYRAERIARTEINSAANWGHYEGANTISKTTGLVLQKVWMAVGDQRTRDTHDAIDGERVMNDQTFTNGLRFPGDPSGPADEIVMCRCTFAHEVIGQ